MVAKRSPAKVLAKVAGALAVVAGVGFLIMKTAQSSRSEPYSVPPEALQPWTLSTETASGPNEPVLLLRPPRALTSPLFDQTFKRSMESMRAPETAGIALALQSELERGGGRLSPDALLELARHAGLESAAPQPRCLGHRRLPEPDTRQQAFFAIFDSPAFKTFRQELATRLGPAVDADFLSPVMLVGTVESDQHRWLPLHVDAEKDCIAPIVTGR